ncbi:hypothetical protein EOM39_07855, partial [Candidatus Gracilibacteria bacterium]|nr:hypothetical protein [Candidatus Gracilibacteria bacterium]
RIAIIDADKQGFLRSESALIQIIGRAARNSSGKVIMYTEKIKESRHPELVSGSGKGKNPFNDSVSSTEGQTQEIYALGNLARLDNGRLINEDGLAISDSMRKAIDLTYYRRKIQKDYNDKNGITPTTIFSTIKDMGLKTKNVDYSQLDKQTLDIKLKRLELEMDIASANLEFEKAAELRDMIIEIKRGGKKKR